MNTTKSYTFLVGKTTFPRKTFGKFPRRYLRAKTHSHTDADFNIYARKYMI